MPRTALAAAAIVVIATTALALPGELVAGETAVFEAVNGWPRAVGLPLEAVMQVGTFVAALGAATVALVRGRRRLAAALALAWALDRLAAAVLKAVVDRDRPPALVDDVVLRQHLPADAGFPSAHSGTAAALAVVAGVTWPRLAVPAAVVAVLVGLGRLYVGVHLPLDLLGGWALGVLCGAAALGVSDRLVATDHDDVSKGV